VSNRTIDKDSCNWYPANVHLTKSQVIYWNRCHANYNDLVNFWYKHMPPFKRVERSLILLIIWNVWTTFSQESIGCVLYLLTLRNPCVGQLLLFTSGSSFWIVASFWKVWRAEKIWFLFLMHLHPQPRVKIITFSFQLISKLRLSSVVASMAPEPPT